MFFLLTSVYKCTAASQSGRGQNYSSLAAEHLEHGWNGANLISPHSHPDLITALLCGVVSVI